ncbi:hypothetical protein DFJ73DRAFT_915228 [Zopfochytrium polystomum]|nr:hypothetical protein DFJ73DRAFT_915228 [Zopfochytrium polystomum]
MESNESSPSSAPVKTCGEPSQNSKMNSKTLVVSLNENHETLKRIASVIGVTPASGSSKAAYYDAIKAAFHSSAAFRPHLLKDTVIIGIDVGPQNLGYSILKSRTFVDRSVPENLADKLGSFDLIHYGVEAVYNPRETTNRLEQISKIREILARIEAALTPEISHRPRAYILERQQWRQNRAKQYIFVKLIEMEVIILSILTERYIYSSNSVLVGSIGSLKVANDWKFWLGSYAQIEGSTAFEVIEITSDGESNNSDNINGIIELFSDDETESSRGKEKLPSKRQRQLESTASALGGPNETSDGARMKIRNDNARRSAKKQEATKVLPKLVKEKVIFGVKQLEGIKHDWCDSVLLSIAWWQQEKERAKLYFQQ